MALRDKSFFPVLGPILAKLGRVHARGRAHTTLQGCGALGHAHGYLPVPRFEPYPPQNPGKQVFCCIDPQIVQIVILEFAFAWLEPAKGVHFWGLSDPLVGGVPLGSEGPGRCFPPPEGGMDNPWRAE